MKPQKPVKQLPAIEVSLFCSQAAMILRSGILLYDGMDVLRQSYADTPYSGVMESVCQAVREGSELHGALAAAGAFPQYMVQMVRAGEMTGHLDEVLARLSVYYESEDRLRSEVRSAVTYPLVLVGMLAVVIGILVVRVLPIFESVFRGLGGGPSGAVSLVLSGGMALGRAMLVLVLVLLAAVLAVWLAWRAGRQRQVLNAAGRMIPAIGRLRRQQAALRFCSVVEMVLSSGYDLGQAMEILPELLQGGPGEEAAARCRQKLAETGDLGQAVQGIGLFEPLHERMIAVGAGTGSTSQVLGQLAGIYDREVETGIQRLAGRIEPTLVAVLTAIIGGILLSVMLPLAGVMSTMA